MLWCLTQMPGNVGCCPFTAAAFSGNCLTQKKLPYLTQVNLGGILYLTTLLWGKGLGVRIVERPKLLGPIWDTSEKPAQLQSSLMRLAEAGIDVPVLSLPSSASLLPLEEMYLRARNLPPAHLNLSLFPREPDLRQVCFGQIWETWDSRKCIVLRIK